MFDPIKFIKKYFGNDSSKLTTPDSSEELSIPQSDMSKNIKKYNKPNKAIIYCRVSTYNQDNIQSGRVSLLTQEANCRTYANSINLPIYSVLREIQSGRNILKQQGLIGLVNSLQKNNLLLVWDVSRFTRDVQGGTAIINKIKNKGAAIYFVNDDILLNSECDSKIQKNFDTLLNYSRMESDIISRRIKSQRQVRSLMGSYSGGAAPYGYHITISNGIRKLTNNKEEQDIIKFIKKNGKKRKFEEIANQFNTNNYKKRGKPWTSTSIRHIYFRENEFKQYIK